MSVITFADECTLSFSFSYLNQYLENIFSSQQETLCWTNNGSPLESAAGVPVWHPGSVTQRWARSPSWQEETGTHLSRWQQCPAVPSRSSTGPQLQQGPRRAWEPGGPRWKRWSRAPLPQAPAPAEPARGRWGGPGGYEPGESGDGSWQRQGQSSCEYEESVSCSGKPPSGDAQGERARTPCRAQETWEPTWQRPAQKRWGYRWSSYTRSF